MNSINNELPAASEINYPKFESPMPDEYDLVIDIDSIRFLHDRGWKILYKKNKRDEINKSVENSKKVIVSVLGNSNRGKTHILQKLSGELLKPGYQSTTRGLSIKLCGENIILLDTAGTNAPLLIENDDEIDVRSDKQKIDEIHSCKIITNHILQSFVINQAHILICVIGMLTASEQIFLNKIKKFSKKKKKLIVIHNLIKCKTSADIEKYVNNVLKKMIATRLIDRDIPVFNKENENNEELFNKYFVEEEDEDVIHFIYGYDGGEEGNELAYYNKSTLSYIMKTIKVEVIKPINIIEDLKTHIKEISSLVLEDEIKEIKEEIDCIKSPNDIKPKNILYDEGDDIIFIGREYEPQYRYYVKDSTFIIEIELCSKYNNLSIKQKYDKDTKETLVKITGERIIEKVPDYEVHFNFGNKRDNYKRFKLELKIKLKELGISHLSPDFTQEMKYGVLFLRNKFNY